MAGQQMRAAMNPRRPFFLAVLVALWLVACLVAVMHSSLQYIVIPGSAGGSLQSQQSSSNSLRGPRTELGDLKKQQPIGKVAASNGRDIGVFIGGLATVALCCGVAMQPAFAVAGTATVASAGPATKAVRTPAPEKKNLFNLGSKEQTPNYQEKNYINVKKNREKVFGDTTSFLQSLRGDSFGEKRSWNQGGATPFTKSPLEKAGESVERFLRDANPYPSPSQQVEKAADAVLSVFGR